MEPDVNNETTEYAVTQWYRAPELILTQNVDSSVDIWGSWMHPGRVAAAAAVVQGENCVNQLELICAVIGTPNEEDMAHIKYDKVRYVAV